MVFATLLYIKNPQGGYLLLERLNEPNKGLLSPPGGKLHIHDAESPYQCAVREANEECGIVSKETDWHLKGIITEKNYPKIGNIMLFLFEYKHEFDILPPSFNEGKFSYIEEKDILNSNIPESDKLYIWKFVLDNAGKFFSVYIDCGKSPYECTVESGV
ncbi:MAG: NUDIX domain-containing protein [Ignavibacteria bacterium]|nr:NUDIX domain-containing protein [Ignavibacteria bacterium]